MQLNAASPSEYDQTIKAYGMPDQRSSDVFRQMALRWKVMEGVGAVLIALAVFIDWPPRLDPSLPETSSFLLILGALVGGAGFLAGLKHE